ncbi:MAG: hypothetical protein SOV54_01775 [Faecalibacterium prausnitzii]|nr:hypothetical protein [Faecalibacterium prausnitzii]
MFESTRAHQELQRPCDAGVSILSKTLQSAPKGGFEQHRPAEKSGGEKSPCGAFLDVRLGVIHPRPPNKKNPNLFPIGEGFGFFVFFGYNNEGSRGRRKPPMPCRRP